jgi:hypothetical protein
MWAWGAFLAIFTAGTLTVRAVIAKAKPSTAKTRPVPHAALWSALTLGAALAWGLWGPAARFAPLVLALPFTYIVVVAVVRPRPGKLRRLGWSFAAASAGAALVLSRTLAAFPAS